MWAGFAPSAILTPISRVLTAIGFARLLEGFRFAISPTDPLTYEAVTILLGAIILAALAVPARRAARVNPLAALRDVG